MTFKSNHAPASFHSYSFPSDWVCMCAYYVRVCVRARENERLCECLRCVSLHDFAPSFVLCEEPILLLTHTRRT